MEKYISVLKIIENCGNDDGKNNIIFVEALRCDFSQNWFQNNFLKYNSDFFIYLNIFKTKINFLTIFGQISN